MTHTKMSETTVSRSAPTVAQMVALFEPSHLEAVASGIYKRDEQVLAAFAADVASIDENHGSRSHAHSMKRESKNMFPDILAERHFTQCRCS